MKGISLTPPWGTLIEIAARVPDVAKHIETRGWSTSYRGELAIHQTKGLGEFGSEGELWAHCTTDPFRGSLIEGGYSSAAKLPRGKIVAVVLLVGCLPTEQIRAAGGATAGYPYRGTYRTHHWRLTDHERAFGGYERGRFGFLLAEIRSLPTPIDCRGQQGLWDVPAPVVEQIRAQLAASSAPVQR